MKEHFLTIFRRLRPVVNIIKDFYSAMKFHFKIDEILDSKEGREIYSAEVRRMQRLNINESIITIKGLKIKITL